MNMNSPSPWLFSDNPRYSIRARLLFMGVSFAIGILTFLVYLCIWYVCTRRRQRAGSMSASDAEAEGSGMSPAAVAALPTFTYEAGGAEGTMECAVCLGQVEVGETVRRLPKCAHSFHADCVDAWLRAHTTCPMCRAPVAPAAAAAATKTAESGAVTATPLPAAAVEAPLPPV